MIKPSKEDYFFPLDIKFGEFLRKSRMIRRQNQTDLGEDLGYNQRTISRWESEVSFPTVDEAGEIARRLNAKMLFVSNEVWERFKAENGYSE